MQLLVALFFGRAKVSRKVCASSAVYVLSEMWRRLAKNDAVQQTYHCNVNSGGEQGRVEAHNGFLQRDVELCQEVASHTANRKEHEGRCVVKCSRAILEDGQNMCPVHSNQGFNCKVTSRPNQ